MLKIGSHVSFSDKGLLTAANEAVSYGSSSFMIYTARRKIQDANRLRIYISMKARKL